jgi:hypothetical protein
MKLFYLRNPLNTPHWKGGVSKLQNAYSRMGTYQNAFGPEFQESWKHIWIGTEKQIDYLEELFHQHWDAQIENIDVGNSEWVSNVFEEEVVSSVEMIRKEYFIKVQDVPEEFKPFTIDKIELLKEWYKNR